jgi:hypothetical protein
MTQAFESELGISTPNLNGRSLQMLDRSHADGPFARRSINQS